MLGTYIAERRVEKGINQKVLAEKIKISSQFLGRIERGEVMIPMKILKRCIHALNLSEKKLVTIYRVAGTESARELFSRVKKKR